MGIMLHLSKEHLEPWCVEALKLHPRCTSTSLACNEMDWDHCTDIEFVLDYKYNNLCDVKAPDIRNLHTGNYTWPQDEINWLAKCISDGGTMYDNHWIAFTNVNKDFKLPYATFCVNPHKYVEQAYFKSFLLARTSDILYTLYLDLMQFYKDNVDLTKDFICKDKFSKCKDKFRFVEDKKLYLDLRKDKNKDEYYDLISLEKHIKSNSRIETMYVELDVP